MPTALRNTLPANEFFPEFKVLELHATMEKGSFLEEDILVVLQRLLKIAMVEFLLYGFPPKTQTSDH